jgi:uncharacterized protein YdhG (YjbR/CyaY superfamily)
MSQHSIRDIDAYIAGFPSAIAERLTQIRILVHGTVPGVEESIRYNMPAFKLNTRHLYIAAYKNHIGMYPMYGMKPIEKELAKYRGPNTKDSLHFPHDKPLPLELIKKIAKMIAAMKK